MYNKPDLTIELLMSVTTSVGEDYVIPKDDRVLEFNPGVARQCFKISSLEDSIAEDTETLQIFFTNTFHIDGDASRNVTLLILDNDGKD